MLASKEKERSLLLVCVRCTQAAGMLRDAALRAVRAYR
jgi:hypothetical protein